MPFSKEYKKKCYCTHIRYPRDPVTRFGFICEEHRSAWDTAFLEIFPQGMRDTTDFTLTFNIGFEKYGAYESWGQGWVAEGIVNNKSIMRSHRYMKQAVDSWLTAAKKAKEDNGH